MRLYFQFTPPRSRDVIRGAFAAMASTLLGRTVVLQQVEHRKEEDRNGLGYCFFARWADGDVTYEESLLHASGNPRDGWGYALTLTLTLPGHTLRTEGSDDPLPWLGIQIDGGGRVWLQLRETLRRELGADSDRSAEPWIAYEVLPVLAAEGELTAALVLARESLALPDKNASHREDIVAWLAANDPASGGPAMRVKEAPGALDGWLALERSGDSTLSEAFARLCPFDLKRWRAAGLSPGPWFSHPAWPLERDASAPGEWKTIHLTADHVWPSVVDTLSKALTGWAPSTDWHDVHGESHDGLEGWRWHSSRRARVPDGAKLPVVHATLSGVRRDPEQWSLDWSELRSLKLKETLTWSWIGGPKTGDALVIVSRELPKRRYGTPEPAAIAFTVVGSAEFRERAEAAVIKETHYRWYPVPASESLKPWEFPREAFPNAHTALEATVPAARLARGKELLGCRCANPTCEHRTEILRYVREDERGETPAATARSAAWNAAYFSVGVRPQLDSMNRCLAEAYRAHVRSTEYVP